MKDTLLLITLLSFLSCTNSEKEFHEIIEYDDSYKHILEDRTWIIFNPSGNILAVDYYNEGSLYSMFPKNNDEGFKHDLKYINHDSPTKPKYNSNWVKCFDYKLISDTIFEYHNSLNSISINKLEILPDTNINGSIYNRIGNSFIGNKRSEFKEGGRSVMFSLSK